MDVELEARDGCVHLVVQDTGHGVPQEYHEKIFEKFFMVDAGPNRSHAGAGIGLYLAREVVAIHEGELRVASPDAGGARFEVVLPLRPGR